MGVLDYALGVIGKPLESFFFFLKKGLTQLGLCVF